MTLVNLKKYIAKRTRHQHRLKHVEVHNDGKGEMLYYLYLIVVQIGSIYAGFYLKVFEDLIIRLIIITYSFMLPFCFQ